MPHTTAYTNLLPIFCHRDILLLPQFLGNGIFGWRGACLVDGLSRTVDGVGLGGLLWKYGARYAC